MPFKVEKKGDRFNVVTAKGPHKGRVHGTHESKASAVRQLKALYANVKDIKK